MVGDVLVPELNGIHLAAVTTRPKLTLKDGVRARWSARRKDWPIACLKGGRGTADFDNVDSLSFVNRLLAQHISRIRREHAVYGLDGIARPLAVNVHVIDVGKGVIVLEP